MNLETALTETTHRLHAAGVLYPAREAVKLIEHTTGYGQLEQIINPKQELEGSQLEALHGAVARRQNREPLAYILEHADFWGHRFKVTSGVLCPRPDSETLVATLATLLPADASGTVVDVGTGSGILLCSILKDYPNLQGIGVDLNNTALEITQENARKLDIADRVILQQADLLSAIEGEVELIVSNPPYIATPELITLEPEVTDHEPPLALDGGSDGLDIYRKLIPQAADLLKAGGLLLLEIGATQRTDVLELFANNDNKWRKTECFKDLTGLDRVVLGVRG